MTELSKNLGLVSGFWSGDIAPLNKKLIWFDTNEEIHKKYNFTSGVWEPLYFKTYEVTSNANPIVIAQATHKINSVKNIVVFQDTGTDEQSYMADFSTEKASQTVTVNNPSTLNLIVRIFGF